ncbi:unnamed protein product [Notodromas monacha]|uniref:NR LBD domain-containing protein n=1 Tax=Notodromas monacha TaxID=399045 RepID=A0A7R9BHJ7_9CRUS|nr:unnamed protein product [Notodromas monacha]CAG0915364.1 unnamed protein product [Notodromas monacha]
MSDEEKVKKKQKIEANRVRRLLDNGVVASGVQHLAISARRSDSQLSPAPAKIARHADESAEHTAENIIYQSPESFSTDLWMERRRYPSSEASPNGIRNEMYSRDEQLQQMASVEPVINSGGAGGSTSSSSIGNNAMNNESLLMSSLLSPQTEDSTCGGSTQMNSQQESGSSYYSLRGQQQRKPHQIMANPCEDKLLECEKEVKIEKKPVHHQSSECTLHVGLDQRRCRSILDPLETVNSVLSVAIRAEFSAASLIGFNHNQKELNDVERAKIYELVAANEAMLSPIDVDASHKHCFKDPSLISVINMTDLAIRRIIKMMKRVNGFKNLCQEDQIALLKGGCTELMILRSVMTYDPEVNSWKIPHTSTPSIVKLDVLKKAGGNLYEEHQRFIKSFTPLWRNDENIMLILGAVTLFSPERPNVIHKDVVKLEQDSYYYLLKRYLESILPGCEAKSQYLQLIHRVQELHYLNENHVRVYLDTNPKEVEPLLIEIFDLMRHQS